MTTISTYSLESDSDVRDLIEACKTDEWLQSVVRNFSPGGNWCVSDGEGGYKKDEDGQYITESLSDHGIANYWKVLGSLEAKDEPVSVDPGPEDYDESRDEPEGGEDGITVIASEQRTYLVKNANGMLLKVCDTEEAAETWARDHEGCGLKYGLYVELDQ